ncbi:hypothetical protein DRO69_00150 [Candidatus Bathyarchaeota archaeon]|mgnify:CR=1 FL=1|nr:MAG: hypothetical protein DRO69_00150 [Candidatus Bathyarchaeota archaeon]
MARVRRKICTRQNGVLVCKEIEMETDVWGEGAFDSVNTCVSRAKQLLKEGRSYAEIIQQLNIQRVWRKNMDPEKCRTITQCMREVAKMTGHDPSRIHDICG